MLTNNELEFLHKLESPVYECWYIKQLITERVQSLIDRGYVRVSKERLGPLGVYTGEYVITVTEAGKQVLSQHDPALIK